MHSSGLVLTTILLSVTQLIQAVSTSSPLFNFTRQGTELSLAASDDGSSEVNISTPFVFYGSQQTLIYVSFLQSLFIRLNQTRIIFSSMYLAVKRLKIHFCGNIGCNSVELHFIL